LVGRRSAEAVTRRAAPQAWVEVGTTRNRGKRQATGQAQEPALVQAVVRELPIEALDDGVLHGLPGLDEAQRILPAVLPGALLRLYDIDEEIRGRLAMSWAVKACAAVAGVARARRRDRTGLERLVAELEQRLKAEQSRGAASSSRRRS